MVETLDRSEEGPQFLAFANRRLGPFEIQSSARGYTAHLGTPEKRLYRSTGSGILVSLRCV
jgi:hypothetical protein